MTYLNYEVFDKAIVVDPIFKKFDKRLNCVGRAWNVRQAFEVKCYAQDAREHFKAFLLESLSSFEDFHVDETTYPPICQIYPFTSNLGDPFLDVCRSEGLENVEKLVCLILFSEHIIAFCDSTSVSTIIDHKFDFMDLAILDSDVSDIEPLFEDKLYIQGKVDNGLEEMLKYMLEEHVHTE